MRTMNKYPIYIRNESDYYKIVSDTSYFRISLKDKTWLNNSCATSKIYVDEILNDQNSVMIIAESFLKIENLYYAQKEHTIKEGITS